MYIFPSFPNVVNVCNFYYKSEKNIIINIVHVHENLYIKYMLNKTALLYTILVFIILTLQCVKFILYIYQYVVDNSTSNL